MNPSRACCSVVAFVAAIFCPVLASAQDPPKTKPLAFTDPAHTDADFAFQGEYEGRARWQGRVARVGLQVIALGEGRFRAVLLWGGLPGLAKPTQERQEADGARREGAVVAQTDDWILTIRGPSGAKLTSTQGKPIGSFKRIERKSPTLGIKPPPGAVVLFAGKDASAWDDQSRVEHAPNGETLLMEGSTSKDRFGSARIHIEFRTPYKPLGRGQDRGNSGVYVQGRYEVQVLDSFGLVGKNNEAGGIYEVKDPLVNMAFPPLAWQTYDIDFTAAKWQGDTKVAPAKMTVRLNGVVVQDGTQIDGPTRAAPVKETPEPGPIYLQNHGNPVRYRNFWRVETDATAPSDAPRAR